MEQLTIFDREQQGNGKMCRTCKHFRALERIFEREDGATIYGYCFKNARNDWSPNMGKGYPVFLPPTCGGACKAYTRERSTDNA